MIFIHQNTLCMFLKLRICVNYISNHKPRYSYKTFIRILRGHTLLKYNYTLTANGRFVQ